MGKSKQLDNDTLHSRQHSLRTQQMEVRWGLQMRSVTNGYAEGSTTMEELTLFLNGSLNFHHMFYLCYVFGYQ